MSKYTTEVRFICESKSGLEDSSGADKIDEIIASSWDKIFTKKAPFFDEEYRSVLCQKILKHYYLREIGCETVGIWKLWMNTRLEEIMPYYNQLYESAKIKFNPLHDVDLTRTHNRNVEGKTKEDGTSTENRESNREVTGNKDTDTTGNRTLTGDSNSDTTGNENVTGNKSTDASGNDKVTGNKDTDTTGNRKLTGNKETSTTGSDTRKITSTSDDTKKDLYTETPQGGINSLENETYLTNARKITDNVNGSGNEEGKTSGNSTDDYTDTEDTKEKSGTEYGETKDTKENSVTNYTETTDTTGKNVTKHTEKEDTKENSGTTYSERGNSTENINGTTSNTGTSNSTEDYLESIIGKHGSGTFSSMLNEFRETFLNIDMQVIEEFNDLFFGLW